VLGDAVRRVSRRRVEALLTIPRSESF